MFSIYWSIHSYWLSEHSLASMEICAISVKETRVSQFTTPWKSHCYSANYLSHVQRHLDYILTCMWKSKYSTVSFIFSCQAVFKREKSWMLSFNFLFFAIWIACRWIFRKCRLCLGFRNSTQDKISFSIRWVWAEEVGRRKD